MKKVKLIMCGVILASVYGCTNDSKKHKSVKDLDVAIKAIDSKIDDHKLELTISLCNLSADKLFLPGFYSSRIRVVILKFDSIGRLRDYTSDYRTHLTMEAMIEMNEPGYKPTYYPADLFADSMSIALTKKIKFNSDANDDRGYAQHTYYEILHETKYLRNKDCLRDTMDFSYLKKDGGHFKVFFYFKTAKSAMTPDSLDGRFYNNHIPDVIKGYKRWQGEILSDTLDLNFN